MKYNFEAFIDGPVHVPDASNQTPLFAHNLGLEWDIMKIEPIVSVGRPLIIAFGAGGFRFGLQGGDLRIQGAVLVLAEQPTPWDVGALADWTSDDVAPILALAGKVEFLLLGTGAKMVPPPPFLRVSLRDHGLGLELMDSANACRAYNHLASEGRHFAAALLPVSQGNA